MSQSKDNLLYYDTRPGTAESQLTSMLSVMINDLRKQGSYSIETSGFYDRASTIVYEDSFISVASFENDKGILNG
tara:strand:- start:145 stop:369 length:225 start_codon:yes stop_codon:yes gene_type:complete